MSDDLCKRETALVALGASLNKVLEANRLLDDMPAVAGKFAVVGALGDAIVTLRTAWTVVKHPKVSG